MKLALVRPPEPVRSIASEVLQHPINLAQLAAFARERAGAAVEIWDYAARPFADDAFGAELRRFAPDLIGFTATTPLVKTAAKLAGLAREIDRGIVTAIGGPHCSAIPVRTLEEFPSFDLGVVGEGELTLAEICRAIDGGDRTPRGIAGTVFRNGERPVLAAPRPLIPRLDDLPYPARDLLDPSLYRASSSPGLSSKLHNITELFTSRGCPVHCLFCGSDVTHHTKVRFRSPGHVLGEAEECVRRFAVDHFTIDDDTFTVGRQRMREICHGLRDLGVSWDCDSRVSNVDEPLLREMAGCGCVKIAFGVESGSQRVLDAVRKKATVPQIEAAFAAARRSRLLTAAFVMIASHPSETWEEVEQTFRLMLRIKPDFVMVYIAVPYPGTGLYEMMRSEGMIESEDWDEFDIVRGEPQWHTQHFSPAELVRLQRSFYRRVYLRPGFAFRKLTMIRSVGDLRYFVEAFGKFFKYVFRQRHEGLVLR